MGWGERMEEAILVLNIISSRAHLGREQPLIVKLSLHPGHQVVDVLCKRGHRLGISAQADGPMYECMLMDVHPPRGALCRRHKHSPGAAHLMGFLMVVPSAQWYSYLPMQEREGVSWVGGGGEEGVVHRVTEIHALGASRHDGAAVVCAELCDGAVEHVDLVEKVHG